MNAVIWLAQVYLWSLLSSQIVISITAAIMGNVSGVIVLLVLSKRLNRIDHVTSATHEAIKGNGGSGD